MRFAWPVLLLLLLAASWSVHAAIQADDAGIRKIPMRGLSLSIPYLDSDMQSRYFEFGEDTIVRADQYIRLTSDRQAQQGWLWARVPMTATNWMVEVEFKIHGVGHLHGDGMAIWLTEERAQPGRVFGSKDNFNGLGVVIDTYKNGRPGVVFPYVMAMLGNSSVSYDKDHDGKDNELAGCSARSLRQTDVPTKIRLTYFAETSFRVDLQHDAVDEWTECFETPPIKLPQTAYLGFSAETGELTDNHDIVAVNTWNLHIRQDGRSDGKKLPVGNSKGEKGRVGEAKPYNPGGDKAPGGWRWFLIKVVLLAVVVVGGYVGFTMYRAGKRGSRF